MGALKPAYYQNENRYLRAVWKNPAPFPEQVAAGKSHQKGSIDYYPGGSPMPSRTFNPTEYRFGMNGQEKVDEISGNGNHYLAEYWEYDPRIIRRWNTDPVVKPWRSPYDAYNNNPILNIDPNGDDDGDYYSKSGKHLGSDGKDDDKVYTADKVTKDAKGLVTGAENAQKLNVTHSDFAISANVVKHESSGNKTESLWIAHSANNAKDDNDIDYRKQNTTLNDQLTDQNYSTTPPEARTQLSVTNNSQSAMNARSAVINVLTGGADPTGGSVLWDGDDLLRRAPNHNKFKEYTNVKINSGHLNAYMLANRNYTINVKAFFKPYVLGTNYSAKGNSKRNFSLHSSGAFGRTVFWKLGPK